jgi:ABC-type glycerol-3-phosphate transport system substrate-binding protein
MKSQLTRLLALLLAGLMILPAASCATGGGDTETKGPGETVAETEEDTGYKPNIQKTNYNADFTVIGTHTVIRSIIPDDDYKAGDPLADSMYERGVRIKDYLGVDISVINAGDYDYSTNTIRSVQAGDDTYQLVAAHCHIGVANLMSSGAMYDIAQLESINLDAPYWSRDFMDELTVQDKYLIGYNDMCLANTTCVLFNKDMAKEWQLEEPYQSVRDKTWTLDKLFNMASVVSKDNGDNVWDDKDVYGISGWGWTDLISFATAADIQIVARDENGDYKVAYDRNSEKTLEVLTKVSKVYDSEYAYFWTPGGKHGTKLPFGENRTLFCLAGSDEPISLRDEDVRFGILPYPMYDERQSNYRSLSWNGVLMVPNSIKNHAMVGDVIEMLAYYTSPVKTAYFEDLLGSKLSEAPEDSEMLDVIWNSQVADVAMVTADQKGVHDLLYMFPLLCRDGIGKFASHLKANTKLANRSLDKLFNPEN